MRGVVFAPDEYGVLVPRNAWEDQVANFAYDQVRAYVGIERRDVYLETLSSEREEFLKRFTFLQNLKEGEKGTL